MTLVIPPGFGLASYVFVGGEGTAPYVTTMGHVLDLSSATADEEADQLFSVFAANMLPLVTSNYTLDRVTLAIGNDGPGGSVDSSNPPQAGLRSTSGAEIIAIAPILRKVTGQFGRYGRGRMFLPGCLTDSDTGPAGIVVTARRTAIDAAAAAWRSDLISFGLAPVLLHGSALIPARDPDPITGLVTSPIVGLLRGRIR